MLGAMVTSNGPEVAPTGIVMLIDVPLQVYTVTAAPFSNTALPPCKAPNPVPEITSSLPLDPAGAETEAMTRAGAAAEVSATLSHVARAQGVVLRLLTALHCPASSSPAPRWSRLRLETDRQNGSHPHW